MAENRHPPAASAPYPVVATRPRHEPLLITLSLSLDYEVRSPTHFLFAIEAGRFGTQRVLHESLQLTPLAHNVRHESAANGVNALLRFDSQPQATQRLEYQAQVLLPAHPGYALDQVTESPVTELPAEAMAYLTPSRFCESDLLQAKAYELFGHLPTGLSRVVAVAEWVNRHIAYEVGSTDARTSAAQVLASGKGVCRDFAHLSIGFCRALNIPARMVVGYICFDDPPQDFHALLEVWLGGQWILVDPTRMAATDRLVRVAVGHDANDVAFATQFGQVTLRRMHVQVCEHPLAPGLDTLGDASLLQRLHSDQLANAQDVLDRHCDDQPAIIG